MEKIGRMVVYRNQPLPDQPFANSIDQDRGFTLIELMVVMVIISVLTSLAVPQFASYRKRAFDLSAETDLHHAAMAEEAYFLDSAHYLSCQDDTCKDLPGIVRLSKGVTLQITGTTSGFVGRASNKLGSGKVFTWSNDGGGISE